MHIQGVLKSENEFEMEIVPKSYTIPIEIGEKRPTRYSDAKCPSFGSAFTSWRTKVDEYTLFMQIKHNDCRFKWIISPPLANKREELFVNLRALLLQKNTKDSTDEATGSEQLSPINVGATTCSPVSSYFKLKRNPHQLLTHSIIKRKQAKMNRKVVAAVVAAAAANESSSSSSLPLPSCVNMNEMLVDMETNENANFMYQTDPESSTTNDLAKLLSIYGGTFADTSTTTSLSTCGGGSGVNSTPPSTSNMINLHQNTTRGLSVASLLSKANNCLTTTTTNMVVDETRSDEEELLSAGLWNIF
jgi:hypothetical protein